MLLLHLREDRDQEEEGGDGRELEGEGEVGGAARGDDGDDDCDCGHDQEQEHGRGLAGRGPFFFSIFPGVISLLSCEGTTTFEREEIMEPTLDLT